MRNRPWTSRASRRPPAAAAGLSSGGTDRTGTSPPPSSTGRCSSRDVLLPLLTPRVYPECMQPIRRSAQTSGTWPAHVDLAVFRQRMTVSTCAGGETVATSPARPHGGPCSSSHENEGKALPHAERRIAAPPPTRRGEGCVTEHECPCDLDGGPSPKMHSRLTVTGGTVSGSAALRADCGSPHRHRRRCRRRGRQPCRTEPGRTVHSSSRSPPLHRQRQEPTEWSGHRSAS